MSYSTVLIIPDYLHDKANAFLASQGRGPKNITVPLSDDEGQMLTHFGAHTYADGDFIGTISAAKAGTLPNVDWAAHGLTEADVFAVVAALIVSAPGSPLDAAQAVDVNAADSARLQTLAGVGPVTAAAIIAGRPWATVAALTEIAGIGPATVADWQDTAIAGPRAAPASPGAHFADVLAAHGLTRI